MSNHLAIAHVTSALSKVAFVAASKAVGGIEISVGRPDPSNTKSRVNVYLYQVVPNGARRNDELPSRGADGQLAGRPRAALDLHYLLSFYGEPASFQPERMAGAVARELHTNPVLDTKRLKLATEDDLKESNLDSAPDRVRITPIPLSLEELSRLWSVLVQTPHTLSVAYEASVVLIDAKTSAPATLPVLRRGKDGRGAIVGTDRVPRLGEARISFTDAPTPPTPLVSLPTAALGTTVIVSGDNLHGEKLELILSHPLRPPPPMTILIPSSDRTESELRFKIPDDAAAVTDWSAGLYSVTVKLVRNGKELFSPVWPLLLAPRLSTLTKGPPGATIDVTAALRPQVRAAQKTELRAGALQVSALPRDANTKPVIFRLDPASVLADELVKIEIDGVESVPVMVDPLTKDFVFDPNQRLTIP